MTVKPALLGNTDVVGVSDLYGCIVFMNKYGSLVPACGYSAHVES